MKDRIKTVPNLLDTSPKHQQAVQMGNDHFGSWTYNVIDRFKGMDRDSIKQELRRTSLPYAVCMEHLIGDFNLGTVIRNANAFNAKEVFYVGEKRRDCRLEVGVSHYTDVKWLPTLDSLVSLKDQYYFIGVDNIEGAVPIDEYEYQFDKPVMFILGEEGVGLTPQMQSYCQDIVYIKQYGSVRSLNVGTASGIIFFDFAQKFNRK